MPDEEKFTSLESFLVGICADVKVIRNDLAEGGYSDEQFDARLAKIEADILMVLPAPEHRANQ